MPLRRSKTLYWAVAIILLLVALLAIGMYTASRKVESVVADWLGDRGEAGSISVTWNGVRVENITIGAPDNWPTKQTFKAARVDIVPQWRTVFSSEIQISSITIHDYQIAVWRQRDGQFELLPSFKSRSEKNRREGKARRQTSFGKIVFESGQVDYYDSQVSRPAHHIRLTGTQATFGPLVLPEGHQRTDIALNGKFQDGGTLGVNGWTNLASHDSRMDIKLSSVSVSHLAPYLQKGASLAFNGGRVGLTLGADVENKRINAKGQLVLTDMKLAEDGLLSLPRKAALVALEDDKGRATFDFTITGPASKPTIKMDDSLSVRIAGGLAGVLGISIEALATGLSATVEGFGGLISGLAGSAPTK